MKLKNITFTGADDGTDPSRMVELSRRFPQIEWGILLMNKKAGTGRYPSSEWLRKLEDVTAKKFGVRHRSASEFRLSAHLCGDTMRAFMKGITASKSDAGAWILSHGYTEEAFDRMFQRTQLNFNARYEAFTNDDLTAAFEGWLETMSGNLITQHNLPNTKVWELFQDIEGNHTSVRAHQVLYDASGGRGHIPADWSKPIAGVLTGYAGGLSKDNLIDNLEKIEAQVGEGRIWIDMETSLRGDNDCFDLDEVESIMTLLEKEGAGRGWI